MSHHDRLRAMGLLLALPSCDNMLQGLLGQPARIQLEQRASPTQTQTRQLSWHARNAALPPCAFGLSIIAEIARVVDASPVVSRHSRGALGRSACVGQRGGGKGRTSSVHMCKMHMHMQLVHALS